MAPVLDEQGRRRFIALEAKALGHGGVSLMARISGLARSTIYCGLHDLRRNVSAPPGRIRNKGGGRKKKTVEDPTLLADLKDLVEPVTRGDPTQPLLWTTRSLRNLVKELGAGDTGFAPRWSAVSCAPWVTACRPTARHAKASNTSIGMRNFGTSVRKPRRSWRRTSRSYRWTRRRRN
jgi:hypothetical protein